MVHLSPSSPPPPPPDPSTSGVWVRRPARGAAPAVAGAALRGHGGVAADALGPGWDASHLHWSMGQGLETNIYVYIFVVCVYIYIYVYS